jgi:hypothetical protein
MVRSSFRRRATPSIEIARRAGNDDDDINLCPGGSAHCPAGDRDRTAIPRMVLDQNSRTLAGTGSSRKYHERDRAVLELSSERLRLAVARLEVMTHSPMVTVSK